MMKRNTKMNLTDSRSVATNDPAAHGVVGAPPVTCAVASVNFGVTAKRRVPAVAMELTKLKHSGFWPTMWGVASLMTGWMAAIVMKRAAGPYELRTIGLASHDAYSFVALFLPIASALLSTRIAGLETAERMDAKWGSLGCSAVSRFMTKLFVTGFASYLCFALPQLGAFLLARRFGFSDGGLDAAGSAHMLTTVLLMPLMVEMVASFAVTAVQLMAASIISKQAVGLALAILAGLVASGLGPMSVPWLGWLFPAGISSAAGPLAGIVAPGGFATVVAAPHAGWLLTGAALAATVWVVVSVMAVRWKEAKR